ncbi:WXG100 family type VII secretion target [Micromonospora sp. NPDC051196]|uniref:WXG100 family type VII secretion target n=1 Tax=Micromonospora sp. NPDC051196 TaxID=3155281 RepID=UPI003423CB1E
MGNISTSEEGMRAAAQRFAATADEFSNADRQVTDQVNMLLTTWKGEAAQGFRSAMDHWGQSFNVVIRELREMQAQMEGTLTDYRRGEDQSLHHTSQLSSGLPGF